MGTLEKCKIHEYIIGAFDKENFWILDDTKSTALSISSNKKRLYKKVSIEYPEK